MKRGMAFTACMVLFVFTPAAAAGHETAADVENHELRGTGWVSAGSPLYAAELAVDNIRLQLGAVNVSDVVEERAAEAHRAAAAGRRGAVRAAVAGVRDAAGFASSDDGEALERAELVLGEVSELVPDAANVGIESALDALAAARDRVGPGVGPTGSAV